MKLTREQRKTLFQVYNRSPLNMSYREFRRTVQPGWGCIMVHWCGMWLCIETDGSTHS